MPSSDDEVEELQPRAAGSHVVEVTGLPADGERRAPESHGRMSAEVARAGTWGLSGRVVLLLANFGATPFTIRLLGPSAYGLWALIQTVLLWVNPAGLGMATATTKYGAEYYALDDSAGEATVVWTGLCLVFASTLPVVVALAFCAHPLLVLLHVRGGALPAGAWALRVAGATFVILQLAGVVNTAQQVRLRWRQYTLVYTLANLVGTVGVPIAIYILSGGVLAATTVGLLASVSLLVGLSWDGLRAQPALRHPRIDWVVVRQVLSYGGALAVWGIAAVPLTTGERIFLSANTSTTSLAYYSVAMTIVATLEILPEQLIAPLMPALTRLEATGSHDEHGVLYQKSLSGLYLALTPLTIIVALVAKPFLVLWAGPAYGAHSTLLLMILLGGMWANSLAWVPSSYLLSSGKTKVLAILQVAEVAPYLGAAWVLTAKWGALGAALVWSSRVVLDSIAHFALVRVYSGLPIAPLCERRLRSMVAPLFLGLASLGVSSFTEGLLPRFAVAVLLLVTYGVAVWWLVLTVRERRGVARLVGDMPGSRLVQSARMRVTQTGRHYVSRR